MESADFHHHLALLDWQVELGATEAISDTPVDRFDVPAVLEKPKAVAAAAPFRQAVQATKEDVVAIAERAAKAAESFNELRTTLAAFEHCDLKKGARNLVFSDGIAGARVMLIGESPDREEDVAGKPFVGRTGQLLDKMLEAIQLGRDREEAPVYITNVLPWRPPQNRDPKPEDLAMMKPFLMRHIELAAPEVIVILGNSPCQALLGKRGITRLRGQWTQVAGRPALPMFHPSQLLKSPALKREAWADFLSLKARLRDG